MNDKKGRDMDLSLECAHSPLNPVSRKVFGTYLSTSLRWPTAPTANLTQCSCETWIASMCTRTTTLFTYSFHSCIQHRRKWVIPQGQQDQNATQHPQLSFLSSITLIILTPWCIAFNVWSTWTQKTRPRTLLTILVIIRPSTAMEHWEILIHFAINAWIKPLFLLQPQNHRSILVPIEYLRYVEGGGLKYIYGHIFNLLFGAWITDKLADGEPPQEENKIFSRLPVMQSLCNNDPYKMVPAAWVLTDQNFTYSSGTLTMCLQNSNFSIANWRESHVFGSMYRQLSQTKWLYDCCSLSY